jgi:hypothetical protein
MRVIKSLSIIALSLLSACVAYKTESQPNADFVMTARRFAAEGKLEDALSVGPRMRTVPERTICAEPLGTVLSLGIIPRYCSDTYQATLTEPTVDNGAVQTQTYETTFVAGWLALFLLPSPNWRYGYQDQIGPAIELKILESAK